MDIYKFFKEDFMLPTEHCRITNYQFTPLEMAAIIRASEEPMAKKHECYTWLIENTADSALPDERMNCDYYVSVHDLLRKHINFDNRNAKNNYLSKEDGLIRCAFSRTFMYTLFDLIVTKKLIEKRGYK